MSILTSQLKDKYLDIKFNRVSFLFNRLLLLSTIFLPITNFVYAFEVESGELTEQRIGELHRINKINGETVMKSSYNYPPNRICYTQDWVHRIKYLKKGLVEKAHGCNHTWTESSNTKLICESTCKIQELNAYIVTDSTKIRDTHYISVTNSNEKTSTTKTVTKQKTTSNFVQSTCSTDLVAYPIKK